MPRDVRIVFDIETAPLELAADYIPQAEAPSNYKDPEKIAAYIADANAAALEKCALDVDLCRVVAIGWQTERDTDPSAMHLGQNVSEQLMLKSFWNLAQDMHFVGFNVLGFDLPVLLRRSLYLGVPAPNVQIDRFRHPMVSDVMQALSFNGALKFRGLSFYAKRFALDQMEDGLSGADIGKAVTDGRWQDVEKHVLADVSKTAQLAEILGLFMMGPL